MVLWYMIVLEELKDLLKNQKSLYPIKSMLGCIYSHHKSLIEYRLVY